MHEPPGVLVRASAGTGKTHRLAVRCIELLARGERLDAILATTFTRKAAGEIRARILEMLASAAADAPGAVGLLRERIPGFDRDRASILLADTVAMIHRIQIMTIDSMAHRMATMVQLEVGLPPGWSILDDLADASVRTKALDRVLDRTGVAGMMPILHDLHDGALRVSIHRTVLDLIRAAEAAWRASRGDATVWDTVPEPHGALDDHGLQLALDALVATPVTVLTKTGAPDGRWAKAHAAAIESASDHDWDTLLSGGLAAIAEDGTYYGKAMPDPMRVAYRPILRHASAMVVRRHRIRTKALEMLVARFAPEYEALKREAGVVRFEDVPRALEHHTDPGTRGAMYFRLDTRFRHVLLDEFQDTSAEQFALVEPMLDEIVSAEGDGRSALIVGDPKQTLYSWRNAAPGLMDEIVRRWPAGFIPEELHLSRRSSPAILEAVNRVFTRINAIEILAASRAAHDMAASFVPHTSAKHRVPGLARIRDVGEPTPQTTEEHEAPPPAWAMAAADLVQEIRASHPNWTIGVLTRRGITAGKIISVLRGRGVYASAERGTVLGDTPAVAAFAALLTLIDHPGHSMAAYLVAMSPVGRSVGIASHTDTSRLRRTLDRLRVRIAEAGAAQLAGTVLRDIAPHIDARSLRRFEQLVEMCQDFDDDPSLRLTVLADRIWSTPMEDPSADLVRVMTVHASKGLEFDAVILPELGDRWAVRPGDVLMDQPDPLAPPRAVSVYATETVRNVSPEIAALHAATLDRRCADELCALYVAMTRAKARLEMVVPAPNRGELAGKPPSAPSAARVLRAALGIDVQATGILWEHHHPGDTDRARVERATPTGPHHAPPSVTPSVAPRFTPARGARPIWRLERTSPSAIATSHTTVRSPVLSPAADPSLGARIGELVHAWFAGIVWIEDGPPNAATLASNPAAEGLDPAVVAAALDRFMDAIRSQALRPVVSREAVAGRFGGLRIEARAEMPFLVRNPDHPDDAVLVGRFDRVVVGHRGDAIERVEIVDYKTDAGPKPGPDRDAWIAERVEHHRPQMEGYRTAASALMRIPLQRIAVHVVFVGGPEVVEVVPEDQ